MAYLPPDRHALALQISAVGQPPDRHTLRLRIAPDRNAARSTQAQTTDAAGRVLYARRYVAAQTGDRWQPGVRTDLALEAPWSNGAAVDVDRAIFIQTGVPLDIAFATAWHTSAAANSERRIDCTASDVHLAVSHRLPWYTPFRIDAQTRDAWQRGVQRDGRTPALPWRNPANHDVQARDRWQPASPCDHQVWLAVGKASARDVERRLPWDVATPIRWQFLIEPPQPPVIVTPTPHCYQPAARPVIRFRLGSDAGYTPPDRHQLAFSLRCLTPRRFDLRSTLHMSHSLSVVRLPDRLPLAVKSVSLSSDRDSWAWAVQLSFADVASLVAIEPTPAGLASVEITLDGHVFTAQIEGYTEDRRFAARGGSASARSRSVQLAAPNTPERAYTNPAAATAQQLALRELEFTGFDLDWQIEDWLVPAGAWAYERASPISALTTLATAAGAMLQSAAGDDTLIIAPRLPALPWAFEAATPQFTLAGGSWLRKGKRWNGGGRYNGVYVSGRDQGVLVRVYRDGTNGSPTAQLVVDPLITAIAPAVGRGSSILADSLPRHEIPIELPLTPFGSAPGLLRPGELGQIEDVVWGDYRAVVDSVQISAEVSAEGLVTARQSASLWRYLP